ADRRGDRTADAGVELRRADRAADHGSTGVGRRLACRLVDDRNRNGDCRPGGRLPALARKAESQRMIYVDIVSDTSCPWCYIGKRRFERALDLSGRNDIAISWRPFQLNPDMPSEGMTRDDYVRAKFGGGDRPRQIYQAIAESGREAGIEFQFSKIRRT